MPRVAIYMNLAQNPIQAPILLNKSIQNPQLISLSANTLWFIPEIYIQISIYASYPSGERTIPSVFSVRPGGGGR